MVSDRKSGLLNRRRLMSAIRRWWPIGDFDKHKKTPGVRHSGAEDFREVPPSGTGLR
jgi:hypothetical protein